MMTVIRRADLTDIPWLMVQLRNFDRFMNGTLKYFPEGADGEQQAREFLKTLIEGEEHCFFIAQNDVRTGLLAAFYAPHFLNQKIKRLNEVFWWVLPAYRGTTTGARLLAAFRACAKERGFEASLTLLPKTIELGFVNPDSLEKLGFREVERGFLMEVHR